jgi:hypothetical protein
LKAGYFSSPSISSTERSLPPMHSPRTSLSLSNGAALRRPVITSLVIVALLIATIRVEWWPHGKAREGSTVDSFEITDIKED